MARQTLPIPIFQSLYLARPELDLSEIGFRLGFAHPPAFHRAFRRWFGVTPSEFREAPQTNPAAAFFGRKA